MRRLVLVLTLGALCAGCGAVDWLRGKPEGRSESAQLLTRADDLLRQGQPGPARDLYAQIAAMPERDALHARALYNLARLHVDPSSGLRDYRAAKLAFDRLLAGYPRGEWESDARAWQAALVELVAREAELAARQAELTMREAETLRLRSEAAKLGADLQRLKRIELNLERRR
jgi:hypothetical protein